MNKISEIFNSFPYLDYEDFNSIAFTVYKDAGLYNLMIDYIHLNLSDEIVPAYGYTVRTTSYSDNLVELAEKVKEILALGIYDHLEFLEESNCYDEDLQGDISFKFNWSDYFVSGAKLN